MSRAVTTLGYAMLGSVAAGSRPDVILAAGTSPAQIDAKYDPDKGYFSWKVDNSTASKGGAAVPDPSQLHTLTVDAAADCKNGTQTSYPTKDIYIITKSKHDLHIYTTTGGDNKNIVHFDGCTSKGKPRSSCAPFDRTYVSGTPTLPDVFVEPIKTITTDVDLAGKKVCAIHVGK